MFEKVRRNNKVIMNKKIMMMINKSKKCLERKEWIKKERERLKY